MTKQGYCKICQFLGDHKYFREGFEKEVREGRSLRHLQTFLRAQGLQISKDSISSHIKKCMNLEIREQRFHEKVIDKAKKPFQKLNQFWMKPSESPSQCKHDLTTQFFDMSSEKVYIKCSRCGKILSSFDPEHHEKKMESDSRNLAILEALRRPRK